MTKGGTVAKIDAYCISQGFDKSAEKAMQDLVNNVAIKAREGFVPQGGVAVMLVNGGVGYVQAMVRWAQAHQTGGTE